MEAVPHLRRGAGDHPGDGGCIMQIVDWVSTGGWTDHPRCVDTLLAAVAIRANDAASDEQRQELLDLIPRMMNTADDLVLSLKIQARVHEFNVYWYGSEYPTPEKAQIREGLSTDHVFGLLVDLLDICDERLGRTNHAPVDLTGVCAVMAAS